MVSATPATSSARRIVIAIGSNRAHGRYGRPAGVVRAAVRALEAAGFPVIAVSPVLTTRALGPGGRDYANAAVLSVSDLAPPALVELLKTIERDFGRRAGRRWGARVLDLDLISWGNGVWPSRLGWRQARGVAVPHRAMHLRDFVLKPMLAVAPDWRHPVLGRTTRQLAAGIRNC